MGSVVTARNEEKVIGRCLASLKGQSAKTFLVVVNDGSLDETRAAASKFADLIVDLPAHTQNLGGTPELAQVFNAGFDVLKREGVDYVLVSGADAIYPTNYVEEIVRRMQKEKLVLSSGIAEGESSRSLSPRGSGRLLESKWFMNIGFRYPLNYGFEVYPVYKALSEGREVAVFVDVKFKLLRRTRLSRRRLQLWGKGMNALNYWFLYAVGRSAVVGVRNPLNGFSLLVGYLSHVPQQYDDIKHFVPRFQKRIFIKRLREVLTGKSSYTSQIFVD